MFEARGSYRRQTLGTMSSKVLFSGAAAVAAISTGYLALGPPDEASAHPVAHEEGSWRRIRHGLCDDLRSLRTALLFRAPSADYDHYQRIKNNLNDVAKDKYKSLKDIVRDKDHDCGSHSAKTNSQSIFNWGFNEAERAKAIAIGEFDQVHHTYNNLIQQFEQAGRRDPDLERRIEEVATQLRQKRYALEQASEAYDKHKPADLKKMAHVLEDEDASKQNKSRGWFSRSSAPVDGDQVAARSVRGWGETAEEFGREEYEENKNMKDWGRNQVQRGVDEAKAYKDEFKNQAERKSNEMAKGLEDWKDSASDYAKKQYGNAKDKLAQTQEEANGAVNAASAKVNEAKKELSSTGRRWWQFWSTKSDELKDQAQEAAQKKYVDAQKEYEAANQTLREWNKSMKSKLWSGVDESANYTQDKLGQLHESVQESLETVKDTAKDEKSKR